MEPARARVPPFLPAVEDGVHPVFMDVPPLPGRSRPRKIKSLWLSIG